MSGVQITTHSMRCTKSSDDTDVRVISLLLRDVTIRQHVLGKILNVY
jgi:hypothetical protein